MISPINNMLIVLSYSLVLFSIVLVGILIFEYFKYKNKYKISHVITVFLFINIIFVFESLYYSLKFSEVAGFLKGNYFSSNEIFFISIMQLAFFLLDTLIVYFILSGHIEFIRRHEDKINIFKRIKKSKNILLLDGDRVYLRKEKEFLEQDGFSVDVATRGMDALRILKSKHIDLMVLEWKLKDLEGETICELARSKGKNKNLKLILHTYSTLSNVEKRILQSLKINKYIKKPHNLHDLTHQIEHLVF